MIIIIMWNINVYVIMILILLMKVMCNNNIINVYV